jgi:hypothetical protein
MLPPSGRPIRGSSPWPSLLTTHPRPSLSSAFLLFRQLQLGQRICIFFLFVGLFGLLYFVFHPHFSGPEASRASCTFNIRFSSKQYLVSPVYSGCQLGQACIVPATYDDCSGPCLLSWLGPNHEYASLRCVNSFQLKSYDEMKLSCSVYFSPFPRSWYRPDFYRRSSARLRFRPLPHAMDLFELFSSPSIHSH